MNLSRVGILLWPPSDEDTGFNQLPWKSPSYCSRVISPPKDNCHAFYRPRAVLLKLVGKDRARCFVSGFLHPASCLYNLSVPRASCFSVCEPGHACSFQQEASVLLTRPILAWPVCASPLDSDQISLLWEVCGQLWIWIPELLSTGCMISAMAYWPRHSSLLLKIMVSRVLMNFKCGNTY